MYIYIYIYTHIHISLYIYIYIYSHIHTIILHVAYISTRVQSHARMRIRARAHMHAFEDSTLRHSMLLFKSGAFPTYKGKSTCLHPGFFIAWTPATWGWPHASCPGPSMFSKSTAEPEQSSEKLSLVVSGHLGSEQGDGSIVDPL